MLAFGRALFVVVLLTAASAHAAVQTIVIGFDQDAAGNNLPHLTLIDEQWASLGVHFNGAFYTGRRTVAFPTYTANFSLNYVCTAVGTSGNPNCNEPIGSFEARLVVDIDFPIDFASLEGYTRNDGVEDGDALIIDAYDAAGNLIASNTGIGHTVPPHTTEAILRPAVSAPGIRRLVINTADTDALDTLVLQFNTNNAPTANSQSVTTPEDTPRPITLTGSDPDGNPLSFIILGGPTHGTLSGSGANVVYTPAANYSGPDSFTFKVNDGQADSNVATVSITVTPVNDCPIAASQSVSTAEDTPVGITLSGSDQENNPLTFTIVSGPANGTLSGSGPNRLYTPNANFFGSDSFTFKVNDGFCDSNVATVSITVRPENDCPSASSQSVTTPEDTPAPITLSGSDPENNPLTFTVIAGPSNGTLSGSGPNRVYTPNANFFGSDSFTFKVNDGSCDSNIATVSITVTARNDCPTADSQSATTDEDTPVGITLTGSDVENDPLTFAIVSAPANGTLSGSGANQTYTPNANFNGSDSFTFKVNDGTCDSALATVRITVRPVNDCPIANSQSLTTPEDTPISVTLTGSDVEGDALTFTILAGPSNGTLSGSGSNRTYTPNANYVGADSFTFLVNDGACNSNVATVTVNVTPVNDCPTAQSDSVSTAEDIAVAITLRGSDVENDPLSFTVVGGPANGTLSGSGANQTYTPNPNFFGTDSFTFKVNDGSCDSNVATISITVTPVNDPPVANDQTVNVCASASTPITLTGSDPVEGSAVTFRVVTPPQFGTLTGAPPNLVYTPATFSTGDSFTFVTNDGESDSAMATVTLVDLTPPSITCPPNMSLIGRCGAASTVANYPPATATDICSSTVTVTCVPPSGAAFPPGTTVVVCTASDAAGNTAGCPFTVTITTPQFKIEELIALVRSFNLPNGTENSLIAKLEAALASLNRNCNTNAARGQLGAFINEVESHRGKTLTDAQANQLIALAEEILAAIA